MRARIWKGTAHEGGMGVNGSRLPTRWSRDLFAASNKFRCRRRAGASARILGPMNGAHRRGVISDRIGNGRGRSVCGRPRVQKPVDHCGSNYSETSTPVGHGCSVNSQSCDSDGADGDSGPEICIGSARGPPFERCQACKDADSEDAGALNRRGRRTRTGPNSRRRR